ncbi:MAG: S41 family peptidase [Terricaulis sp.]
MWTRRAVLGGAAACGLAPAAWASSALRGADLRGDVAILRNAYETLHPGLYRYNTPRQMAHRFDALAQAWSRDQTRSAAYLSLSRFLAAIRCGHTYANFYNQKSAVKQELFDRLPLLPFQFAWLDGRMIVLRNQSSDARLAPGTEIVSIDGRSSASILHALMPFARADGSNDSKRRALLEVRGYDAYETFDIFYGLLFRPRPAFHLRARHAGGQVSTFDVAAIDLPSRRAAMRADENSDAPNWTVTYPSAQTALLTMPSWALYDSHWDWRGFLDASFGAFAARGVTKLIVDVRGNEGGLDCGNEILARCIDAPLSLETSERRVRYRQTPARLNAYLDTWDNSFRDWGDDAQPIGDGWYRLRSDDGDGAIAPKGPRFSGELVVLIDAENSSATFQFAQLVQQNRLGKLIGEPTGGNQRGINGGAFFFVRLPASNLEADLPLIGRFAPTPKPDAGLTPDIAVAPTAGDIAAGADRVLQAALS